MKLGKGETRSVGPTAKIEVEIEKTLIDQLTTMEAHTKISKAELVATALKRFISAHKDYFPDSSN